MALGTGTQLGNFEIVSSLGAGGMGEVYRARDIRLGREVAIKVLPDGFADEPERMARFEREARVLASLNHNNIATLYGYETAASGAGGQAQFLVMEVVEGETLAERIARGAMTLDEVVPLFLQICEGLDAAHEKGVIHRDLKPANVKIGDDGVVKILDFGLAKALSPETASPEGRALSESPTLTLAATQRGEILGTAAYMAPEQARGQAVDRRVDLWAFGVCLYEALSGQRMFHGDTAPDTLAKVLEREPDWQALPAATPWSLRRLLERCLMKDPRRRLHHIADARLELEDLDSAPPVAAAAETRQGGSRRWLSLAAATFIAGLMLGALVEWRPGGRAARGSGEVTARFTVRPESVFTPSLRGREIAVATGKRYFAFGAINSGERSIYMHDLQEDRSYPVRGTEGGRDPFFSPDGQWLGFRRDDLLLRVPLEGGLAQPLGRLPDGRFTAGVAWGAEQLFFSQLPGGLFRIARPGSEPVGVLGQEGSGLPSFPEILPGEKHLLFQEVNDIKLLELATGEVRDLGLVGQGVQYVDSGHLIFGQQGDLWSVAFDAQKLEVTGAPRVVQQLLQATAAQIPFAVSRDGTVVSKSAESLVLVEISNDGDKRTLVPEPGLLRHPRWSRDGRHIAYTRGGIGTAQIWIHEVSSGRENRLRVSSIDVFPVWTADDRIVYFSPLVSEGVNHIEVIPADRSAEPVVLFESPTQAFPLSVSPRGVVLFFYGNDLWRLDMDEPDSAAPWLETAATEANASFSPDGLWVAYDSDETGVMEVYVRPLDGPGGAKSVSVGGGQQPVWSPDGRVIYYTNERGLERVAARVVDGDLDLGTPEPVSDIRFADYEGVRSFDPNPSGDGFIGVDLEGGASQFRVILNLEEELRREETSR